MDACKDLFEEFGGHEQAAGLTISEANVPLLRARINELAVTVIGMGLVGLITAQLLRANGCRVVGVEVIPVVGA